MDLKEEVKEQCRKLLKSLKIDINKIVCLHVRDHGYYNDMDRRKYRNSSINNYTQLIEYLTRKNYFVVRLGDKSAKKLNLDSKYFLDYPFTELKSEIMDLFLINQCQFYIGTPSGPMDTAYLFNKPVLLTNLYDIYPSFPRKNIDRGIFRKIKKKESGELISLKEFAKLSIGYHQTEVDINEFYFEENSSNELVEAIKEYEKNFEKSNKFQNEIKHDEVQISFNKYINNSFEEKYNLEFFKDNYFKNDIWKKNEFIKIVKDLNHVKELTYYQI